MMKCSYQSDLRKVYSVSALAPSAAQAAPCWGIRGLHFITPELNKTSNSPESIAHSNFLPVLIIPGSHLHLGGAGQSVSTEVGVATQLLTLRCT